MNTPLAALYQLLCGVHRNIGGLHQTLCIGGIARKNGYPHGGINLKPTADRAAVNISQAGKYFIGNRRDIGTGIEFAQEGKLIAPPNAPPDRHVASRFGALWPQRIKIDRRPDVLGCR